MKNPPYFIIGLPRSRTAWLANLLTTGPSFCWHEASRYVSSIWELNEKLENTPGEFVGNADSNILNYELELFLWLFPESKFVIIERPIADALESYSKAFPAFDPEYVGDVFVKLAKKLDVFRANIKTVPCTVKYEALDRPEVCAAIQHYLLPAQSFNRERCLMLQQMRVDTVWDKMEAAMHPVYQDAIKRIRSFQSILP